MEYLSISEARILDEHRQLIKELPKDLDLSHGTKFNFIDLLPSGTTIAKYFEIVFYDPNTDKQSTHTIEINHHA